MKKKINANKSVKYIVLDDVDSAIIRSCSVMAMVVSW